MWKLIRYGKKDILVVPDYLQGVPLLSGQSFTEQLDMIVTKTNNEKLEFIKRKIKQSYHFGCLRERWFHQTMLLMLRYTANYPLKEICLGKQALSLNLEKKIRRYEFQDSSSNNESF